MCVFDTCLTIYVVHMDVCMTVVNLLFKQYGNNVSSHDFCSGSNTFLPFNLASSLCLYFSCNSSRCFFAR